MDPLCPLPLWYIALAVFGAISIVSWPLYALYNFFMNWIESDEIKPVERQIFTTRSIWNRR
jgi:hypothetical protein